MSTPSLEDKVAAKLTVLIEGIADHKMTDYNIEALARELCADIRAMCAAGSPQ